MEQKEQIKKARRKTAVMFWIFLVIAFGCIGFSVYQIYSFRSISNAEPIDISGVAREDIQEGQYVKIESTSLPVMMTPPVNEDCKLYFVTDVNDQTYIVSISAETSNRIVESLNMETGKIEKPYEIKGIATNIDEQVRKSAISNSFKQFKNEQLNSDNFSEYLGGFYLKENYASHRTVEMSKILVFTGLLFLVVALGYVLPYMVRISRGNFGILDEKRMMQALEKNLPGGEALMAGIHAVGLETEVKQVFGKCICDGNMVIPSEDGGLVEVTKCKYSTHDLYVGITGHYLIFSECEEYKHYYKFDELENPGNTAVWEIDSAFRVEEIGKCFPLEEIASCKVGKAKRGAVKCLITMKNGSSFKLMFPKDGGPGMPNHERYCEAIVKRLGASF